MPEIHIEGLVKEFGEQRALDDVGFSVRESELFTLLGPSGCGKSTTLLSLAGFHTPERGTIAVGDDTFFDASRRVDVAPERRNLGIVFQSYAVWPHMTVFANLAFPLKVRKLKRKAIASRVRDTLELVEMADYADRYPHQLSGGQQQRVALARALVYSPSVMLLDEPFSNLDAKLRERARMWVKDLQKTLGLTTVFVTHDQDEALSMSDRIAVMNARAERDRRRPPRGGRTDALGRRRQRDEHLGRGRGERRLSRRPLRVQAERRVDTLARTDAATRGRRAHQGAYPRGSMRGRRLTTRTG